MRKVPMLCVFVALGACAAVVASACDSGNPAFDGVHARDASSFSGDAGVVACTEDAGTCQHEGGYSAAAEPPSFATGDAQADGSDAAVAMMRVRGSVREVDGTTPIPFAVLAIEKDGLYVDNADPSRANPSYVYGGRANANGDFDLMLPKGALGIHTFLDNYQYGRAPLDGDGGVDHILMPITMAPRGILAKPSVTGVRAEPSTVDAGDTFFVRALVVAASCSDPISEEVLLIEPTTSFSAELDPPCKGKQGQGYPDGEYARLVRAPKVAGDYTYYLTATSEQCITGDVAKIVVTVK